MNWGRLLLMMIRKSGLSSCRKLTSSTKTSHKNLAPASSWSVRTAWENFVSVEGDSALVGGIAAAGQVAKVATQRATARGLC